MARLVVMLPTYNAENDIEEVLSLISSQISSEDKIQIVDSSSTDKTVAIAKRYDADIMIIPQEEFSHSGTRSRMAAKAVDEGFDYGLFMTQDVYLQKNAIKNLLELISSEQEIGAVFGKQEVDLVKGNLFEYYARSFNYPEKSEVWDKTAISEKGIKTVFISDAFSIYNLRIIAALGYFGDTVNMSEDMLIADKLIQNGYKIGYSATAKVYHTHNFKISDEYKRYKLIGRFYKENQELVSRYGKTNSNGMKLAIGEVIFLIKKGKLHMLPKSLVRNAAKFIGHKIG
ncbi:glycosyltransferase family A protein [Pseudolactococcus yaeyamensis]